MIRDPKQRLIALCLILATLACSGLGATVPTPTSLPIPTDLPPVSDLPIPTDLEIVQVASVVDGDTIELTDGRRVRYIGINTPERGQPYYAEAKAANERLVSNLRVGLERDLESFDRYGRILAYVWVNKQMANLELINMGVANAFTVQPNVRYEIEFRQAEQQAREAGRGLWAGADVPLRILDIHANAPGSDSENPNGEWIEIINDGGEQVNMIDFTLKDEANHIYTFRDFSVPSGGRFRLYSGTGQDTPTELFWGLSGESIWNNDSDTAFLRDMDGALVDVYTY